MDGYVCVSSAPGNRTEMVRLRSSSCGRHHTAPVRLQATNHRRRLSANFRQENEKKQKNKLKKKP